ncbi:hypothetical protein ACFQ1Q_01610 [Winogradskyella litorisediminis]|uniref:Uncharacterized protein n=1 Tax=Winogradskyella litorisediminis TaxID=1156618 RepID=A0ABW3N5U6_9FLAO
MNKTVQTILLVVGVILVGYGIYQMIAPEASIDIGPLNAEVQDNNNAYIAIALGVVALVGSFIGRKK